MARSLRGSPNGYQPTLHAANRMKQRRFSPDDVRYMIRNGQETYESENLRVYYVPDSPFASLARDPRRERLAGCKAIVDVERGRIVTVYDRYLDEIGFVDRGML